MLRFRLSIWIIAFGLACTLALLVFTGAQASPAAPLEFTITQPDGSVFSARQWGDEWNHGTETLDGYSILKDPGTGYWVYATLQPDGSLTPSLAEGKLQVVGKADTKHIPKHLRPTQLNMNPRTGIRAAASTSLLNGKFTGIQPTLVILVKFLNQDFTILPTTFHDRFFVGYTSVSAYYDEVSYDQMDISPVTESHGSANDGVVGWLTLPYNHPNPGKGVITRQLVKDAILAADPYIDYNLYDFNSNGIISTDELHLFIVAAGYEASYAPSGEPAVWANNWWLDGIGCPSLDGVLLGCIGEGSYNAYGGGYSIIGEMMDDHMSTIGVMVHELGHDIGWPDLYNTNPIPLTNGVGYWSVMGDGSWGTFGGYDGNSPTHPGAWEKYYQGWLAPTAINSEDDWIYAPQVESNPTAYLLRHNSGGVDWDFQHHSGRGEYFLAEYRQKTGFDQSMPGCGVLIWHINETAPWDYTANNSFQPLISLEQADGNYDLENRHNLGDAGDPYPGNTNNIIFDTVTTPNSLLYSGINSGVKVYITDDEPCPSSMSLALVAYTHFIPVTVNYPPPWTTITGEMFEGGDFPKVGWNIGETDYRVGARQSPCQVYDGLWSGWMIGRGPIGNTLPCGSNYPDDLRSGYDVTLTYGPFSTVGATAAQLTYHYWTNLEPWYDYLWVGVSANNSYYTEILYTGNSGGWQFEAFDINDPLRDGSISYLNLPTVWVRFRLETDPSINYPEGAYLDNILLRKCTTSTCSGAPP
jgi:M6 family metalloprotease-like protein